jgi:glucokinase
VSYSIGIDIGGTKIAAGFIDRKGNILYQLSVPTPQVGREEVLRKTRELIEEVLEWAEQEKYQPIAGIGIGTAGQIDFSTGTVLSGTTNIVDWNNVSLRNEIESYFSLPVWVDNDVNVIVLAENYLGAAKGAKDVVCLALGTGVGGGVISGGRMIRGSWGGGAELGHISIQMDGPMCNCGFRGCLELYASGTGIARMMKEKLGGIENTDSITSEKVFRLYHEGDTTARDVVEKMVKALSFGIISFIHTFNPSLVILGGGVMKDGDWIISAVKEELKQWGLRSLVDPVSITMATLGPEAGLIGAAYQAFIYNQMEEAVQ